MLTPEGRAWLNEDARSFLSLWVRAQLSAKGPQHAFAVIPGESRFDHRDRPIGRQACQQQGTFDLGAGYWCGDATTF